MTPIKGSFVSGSRCLCQISPKSVKNCDRESADRQTHTQTEMTGVIGLTENAGRENDGPSKLQDMKMTEQKLKNDDRA